MERVRNGFWYGFLGVSGATAIAVEIVGLRLLAPLFGSSLPIWGVAIATVLAGLAWGYNRGGLMAQQAMPGQAQGLVFRQATVGATVFLWMPAVFQGAGRLREAYFAGEGGGYMIAAFILAYGALLLPSVIFGMVNPLAVQAESERQGLTAGQASGRISAITTWGSLVGILLPSLLTIPFLGSRATVWLFAGVVWAGCGWWLRGRRESWSYVWWWAAAGVVVTLLLQNGGGVNVLAASETAYQHVEVLQLEAGRALIFDGRFGIQSLLPTALYTGHYWDYLAGLPIFLEKEEVEVLVVGAAASTTERQMERFWRDDKLFRFTSVELDGELLAVVEKYFEPPERRVVVMDGRMFVAADTATYDLIVVDAYARELSIPFQVATTEFFGAVKERLASGGLVAININAGGRDSLWLRSLARGVGEHFSEVRVVTVPDSCNFLLLAGQRSFESYGEVPQRVEPLLPVYEAAFKPRQDGWRLTDDKAATDWLGLVSLWQSSEPDCA